MCINSCLAFTHSHSHFTFPNISIRLHAILRATTIAHPTIQNYAFHSLIKINGARYVCIEIFFKFFQENISWVYFVIFVLLLQSLRSQSIQLTVNLFIVFQPLDFFFYNTYICFSFSMNLRLPIFSLSGILSLVQASTIFTIGINVRKMWTGNARLQSKIIDNIIV